MVNASHSYKSATKSAFKDSIQKVIVELGNHAAMDGCDRIKDNFKFVISQVEDNWVIVLLVFTAKQKSPKQYVETIPVK